MSFVCSVCEAGLSVLLWTVFYCEAMMGLFIAMGCGVLLCVVLQLGIEVWNERRVGVGGRMFSTLRPLATTADQS